MQNKSESSGSVVVRLLGGLGNQMFQYAAALSLAERQKREILVDVSAFDSYKDRPYQLNFLRVPINRYQGIALESPTPTSFLARMNSKLRKKFAPRAGIYREPHFHFDSNFFGLSGHEILLYGYFQSPRYFAGVEALLRKRFRPAVHPTSLASYWTDRIAASPCAVSLHVRRGDYVTTAAAVHAALDQSYYDRAVALMQDLVGRQAEFFLFSDEPDFIAHAFAKLPRAHVVRTDPAAPWEDMFLMARCQHHIIANSSYSWWGAWLNANDNKRVIAPARWFTPDMLATCNVLDVYPDDWILLK